MKAVRVALAIIAVYVAMVVPIRARAQALPELPASTVSELYLVNQQAGDLAFNMNGVKLPSGASSILILNGIYKTMQAYNEWAGGEEYIIEQAYQMERQNMPAWLAQYSGDYIFWEISFFGDHINMITDPNGQIVLTPSGSKALNVMIDQNMDQAVKLYKSTNNNSVESMPYQAQGNYTYTETPLRKPFIVGKELHFFVQYQGVTHEIMMSDFTQCFIAGTGMTTWNLNSFPAFLKMPGSSNETTFTFYDVTTQTTLNKIQYVPGIANNTDNLNFSYCYTFSLNNDGNPQVQPASDLSYLLPGCYRYFNRGSQAYKFSVNRKINGIGFFGSSIPELYQGADSNTYTHFGLYLDVANGAEVQGNTSSLPVVGTQISADSITTIMDAIAEIEPVVDPVTGIEIIEIPQNFPLPENVPLEDVPVPSPIPGGIEDFPQSDPEVAPPYDPSLDPSTTPTEDTLPDSAEQIQLMEELQLVTGLQNRFPFSIPWDIYNAFQMLQAEREIPHWEWTMEVNLPTGGTFQHTFVLDLEFINPLVNLFRDLFLLAFIIGLAVFSYNKFFGGGA